MFMYIHASEPITANFMDLVVWTIIIGILALCVHSAAIQFKNFANEVFDMATREMAFRNFAKIRLLLYQTHNSGEFTAAGFIAVEIKLMILFSIIVTVEPQGARSAAARRPAGRSL
ncbi:hypothetical protein J6590_039626 [Homalodisca vitripennis]|nr:hypothetical protein J6590_039626 [Homalodisca vitripennis]